MDLRDAFMIQGFSGADALDKAAKYVIKPVINRRTKERCS